MNLVASLFDFSWFSETLRRPTSGVDMLVILGLVLIGFLIGIVVGWVWRPRWAGFSDCVFDGPVVMSQMVDSDQKQEQTLHPSCSSSVAKKDDDHLPKDEDLKHLWHLVEKRDGGPPWKHMMDGSTATMTYQAWQRDLETGPPQYCSMTVYEEATPELLRDFFWDDDLRLKWDDMLLHATTLEEFPAIGASVVHWIRKFPLFCSDREYIIGRRIWELEGSFYCVTKGVPCSSVPRKQRPRRVDVYYSSWFIRPVASKKRNNQPACEVIFFHYEDMGIPWELAKFGVRQGMWGTAKKIERGLRWYQKERACSETVSHHVTMARMSTKINQDYLARLESESDEDVTQTQMRVHQEKPGGIDTNIPKLLVIGAAVALACSIDRGQFTKAVIFGVAKRFGNIGRRAFPAPRL
ncbi:putative START domain-containing protein [Helianthus annuus]|uniref:Putative START domain, START-like domain protein n=1 Tax=Helianthus annuus TaxID=4232 RepID=A0A251TX38_HELAN|nr:uncharacterized protein LOC110877986 [Helianthus annuus]KAF5810131.1 putative START domain-containing protein [Helianthus annuus]KAJ0581016.1 putative START domain-containing protein [Helianthus annuus]KAJ0588794.1 putative START domain-containing protein [Helianthus annuus]KAJ0596959.1 putative START domain-containing protein [Helianthus annuus]KAJ0757641.1 putative START domain-containing protein [Helianthus annuus]